MLVGGWVRDCLLGVPHSKDFDLEVFGLSPKKLQQVLTAFGPVHTVGRHFGVLKLTTREAEYDVSVPRRENKIGKGHKHFQVEPDPHMTFEEAASRRDFTINSMGYDFLSRQLLDPFHAQGDLETGQLRHVGESFGEDPLRVLRAMQFVGRFNLHIPEETLAICRGQDLHELPPERLWEEFRKLLLHASRPSHGLKYAGPLGIMPYFPELERLAGRPEDWGRTLAVVDQAAAVRGHNPHQNLVMMTAALCHRMEPPADNGPGPTMEVAVFLARLTNETHLTRDVLTLVESLPLPEWLYQRRDAGVSADRPLEGFIRRLALNIPIPFLLKLAAARYLAEEEIKKPRPSGEKTQGETGFPAGDWLEAQARKFGVLDGPPKPLLQGRHLKELGMTPGPAMGEVVRQTFELQLDGKIHTLPQALDWAKTQI